MPDIHALIIVWEMFQIIKTDYFPMEEQQKFCKLIQLIIFS